MLRQRLLAALVLIPVTVAAVLGLDSPPFALLTGAIALLAAWEWSRLIPLHGLAVRLAYLAALAGLAAAAWFLLPATVVVGVALAWWMLAALWLNRPQFARGRSLLKLLIGPLLLVPAWWALVRLHADSATGPWWVLYLLVLVWVADSGAYLAGRLFGRHKLAPAVSPGKTWEGVGGALALSAVFATLAAPRLPGLRDPLVVLVGLSLATVLVSILGDLTVSLFKRQSGIKDTGHLIPGHGGVLDRIDSLCSALPLFWLGLRGVGG